MGRMRKREIINYWIDYIRGEIELLTSNNIVRQLSPNKDYTTVIFRDISIKIEKKPFLNDFFSHYIEMTIDSIPVCFLLCGAKKQKTENIVFRGIDKKNKKVINWKIFNKMSKEEKQNYEIEVKIIEQKRIETIEVTGTACTIYWIWFFLDFFDFFWLKIKKLLRIDLFMDLDFDINYLYEIMEENQKKKITKIYNTDWLLESKETINLGEKSKKNTYKFLRIYNKKIEAVKSKKWSMYEALGYGEYNEVTRIELEYRQDTAKFWTQGDLINEDTLFYKCVKNFYPLNYQFFSFVHLDDCKKKLAYINQRKREANKIIKLNKRLELEHSLNCSPFSANYSVNDWIKAMLGYYRKLRTVLTVQQMEEILQDEENRAFWYYTSNGLEEPLYKEYIKFKK